MLFTSISFLYYFLPVVLILYLIVPNKFKNVVLLLASIVFYFFGEGLYLLLILLEIVVAYIGATLIEKSHSKNTLIIFISFHLGLLGLFKYSNFFIENINSIFRSNFNLLSLTLPLGISFYTFQIISYLVDVYRKECRTQKNIFKFILYVSLFPQLVAGPIVRYSDISKEIDGRKIGFEDFSYGVRRFILGLAKKVLIANMLGEVVNAFGVVDKSVMFYWLFAISYMLQLYFDFSAYSDMAIGLGRMFGFHFLENFNYPYIAQSITEFWRRWHISLSSWFRDYVYIPLGGSRCGKKKLVRNILIIWMLTGFWHGASWNFIVWGLLFGVLLTIEKLVIGDKIEKIPKVIRHLYVLFVVMISFIIFNSNDIISAFHNISGLFGGGGEVFINDICLYYLNSYGLILLMACFGATPICKNLVEKISKNKTGKKIINILEPVYLGVLLLIVTTYLIDGSYNPFLYFRF
ncbi:MAG: MBOAT family protein [Tenericutes bacterium]|nr:MBOAT family protein [Mycoplasmatota bacterium]